MRKQTKIIFCLCLFVLPAILLPAHEFWLQPERFICKRGETINIRFKLGENFHGSNWEGNASRTNTLRIYMGGAKDDLSRQLSEGKGDSLQVAMFDEGTTMICYNSTNSFLQLDAPTFNEYLEEYGLKNVIELRKQQKLQDSAGRELYQMSIKTLVQVGSATNECYKQVTELPLDIIPQSNPYTLKNNQRLVVRLLMNKTPLVNADVRLWHRIGDTSLLRCMKTDQKGEIGFKVNTAGRWMISALAMNHLENQPMADWQSYWGSFTWGYQ
jgi:uncharacterized GH25 family protein